jgi:hypothetical protein
MALWNVPAAHGVHDDCPPPLYVPAAHAVHDDCPLPLYSPALHGKQLLD